MSKEHEERRAAEATEHAAWATLLAAKGEAAITEAVERMEQATAALKAAKAAERAAPVPAPGPWPPLATAWSPAVPGLVLCDLDDTLISSYMENPDKNYHQWAVLPGRVEKLAALKAAGHTVGVVTNQAGVAHGLIAETDFYRKWTQVCAALGWNADSALIAVCYAHPQAKIAYYAQPRECIRRKPHGTMIRELMAERAADVRRGGVIFVGDRPEDEQAARDAGVPFQWAHEFFGEAGHGA